MSLPERKPLRLQRYDYSGAGYYFVTVCVQNKRNLLRRGTHCAPGPGFPSLSEMGETVEQTVLEIPSHYPNVKVDKYIVMPNHIHLILVLEAGNGGRTMFAPTPTLSQIVRMMKETVTKRLRQKIWQKGFYDHIIRNEADYLRIWQYIDTNPAKWEEDEYYTPDATQRLHIETQGPWAKRGEEAILGPSRSGEDPV